MVRFNQEDNMKLFNDQNLLIGLISLLPVLLFISLFDNKLSIGLGLLAVLSYITFFIFSKFGLKDKKIYLLFFIVLVIHISATLFMYYANFQPFSGGDGDYVVYQKSAVEFSQSFRQGEFSLKNIATEYPGIILGHYYPIIVGAVYALTTPAEIIGLLLNVWLATIAVVLTYLIVLEVGGTWKSAFLVGLLVAIYPSYLFMTSLLLKEAIEIFFVLLGLLFIIKTIKNFSWKNFIVLYLALICATHFRFYIGYALIAAFVLSWVLFSNIEIKKRLIYGVIFIALLGFIPQVAADQGYCGINSFKAYLNFHMVNFYRKLAYTPVLPLDSNSSPNSTVNNTTNNASNITGSIGNDTVSNSTDTNPTGSILIDSDLTDTASAIGVGSSFVAENTVWGYAKSFIYVLFGPFPWQIKNIRQSSALVETIPWYILLFFIVDGIIIAFRKKIKEVAPLLIFSIMAMAVMAIFNSNFGIIVRIRIPAFISLLCIASLSLNNMKFIDDIFSKAEDIFNRSISKLANL